MEEDSGDGNFYYRVELGRFRVKVSVHHLARNAPYIYRKQVFSSGCFGEVYC